MVCSDSCDVANKNVAMSALAAPVDVFYVDYANGAKSIVCVKEDQSTCTNYLHKMVPEMPIFSAVSY